jgi:hypothetical protein
MTADTRDPHLDLGDLIAEAAGQPVGDRAREHLAGCAHCRLEADRWGLVADGVRSLAATAPEPAQPLGPRRPARRAQAPWRRAMVVAGSAAAALVLLAGVGAAVGVVHVHLSGPKAPTVLTAVSGCDQLEQADGTLEQVDGSRLVVQVASGPPLVVTTTASTLVSMSGPLVSDITDGAPVMVRGHTSGATIQAAIVTVGQPFSAVNPPGFTPVEGTVSGATTAGFTLVTPSGARFVVTTSGSTLVVVPHASPGQLRAGTRVIALGTAGPDGTLSARAVAAVSQLPGGTLHAQMNVKDCSQSSIAYALGAISTASANGR